MPKISRVRRIPSIATESKKQEGQRQPLPRLSDFERLVLQSLREQELFGLQFTERTDGVLKRGTIYVTLGRMRKKGYVTSRVEPLPPGAIGQPRRWYRPTPYGLRLLDAWTAAEVWYSAHVKQQGAA